MTRGSSSIIGATVAAVALLALAGCADAGSRAGSGGGATGMDDLSGRTFLSTAVTQDGQPHALVKGSRITLSFDDTAVGAQAGCNSMSGGASLDGGVLTISGNGLASTEMGCDPPLMDQDTWLAGILTSGPTVTLDADALTLTSGDTVIEFQDKESAEPDVSLTGTTWTLDSIGDGSGASADGSVSSVPMGVTSTLAIGGDGSVSLHPGCNTGHGQVEIGEGTLTFGPIATTRMMCPDDQMGVENTVLKVLDGQVTYEIDSQQLTISSDAGTLTYRATS
jgi:heat shock protein HslJ